VGLAPPEGDGVSGRGLLFLLVLQVSAAAQAQVAQPHLAIVTGLGGEKYYSDLFYRWATTLNQVATSRLGISPARVIRLAEDPSRDPESIDAPSRKEQVLETIERLGETSGEGDVVALVYLGHASASDGRALLNLPGPDLSAAELGSALDALAGRTVVVVIAAPSSAPFVEALSAPGRIVITATANTAENQHTRFGGYFVDAFAEDAADLDKDKQVSLLEAFRFATREVALGFETEGRIRTEHALLDDDGDGAGSRDPGSDGGDGMLAARVHLKAPAASDTPAGREALALQIEARRLVDRIEETIRKKRSLESADYLQRLEALLVELALNRRAYRAKQVK
jgi:hypothetical protein